MHITRFPQAEASLDHNVGIAWRELTSVSEETACWLERVGVGTEGWRHLKESVQQWQTGLSRHRKCCLELYSQICNFGVCCFSCALPCPVLLGLLLLFFPCGEDLWPAQCCWQQISYFVGLQYLTIKNKFYRWNIWEIKWLLQSQLTWLVHSTKSET